jgi:hypothetical protein
MSVAQSWYKDASGQDFWNNPFSGKPRAFLNALTPGATQMTVGDYNEAHGGVPDWTWLGGTRGLGRRWSGTPVAWTDEDFLQRSMAPMGFMPNTPNDWKGMTQGAGRSRQQALSALADDYSSRGLSFAALRPDLANELTHLGGYTSYHTPTAAAAPGAPTPAAPGVTNPVTGTNAAYTGGTNTGASALGTTAAQRMALASDPQQAFRYAMQQAGLNPDAPGLLGNFLKKRFQPLLEARMAAAGVGDSGNYMDTIDSVIRDFGLSLMGQGGGGGSMPGGDFYGGLAGIANQAQQQGGEYLNNLSDQSQAMQYLQQLGSLRFAGANPLVAQSAADVMERTRNQYQDVAFQNELAGRNIDPFTTYLKSRNPFTYRTIFGY